MSNTINLIWSKIKDVLTPAKYSQTPSFGLLEFLTVINESVKSDQTFQAKYKKAIAVVAGHDKVGEFNDFTITWEVFFRDNATFEQTNDPLSSTNRRVVAPVYLGEEKDPENPGYNVIVTDEWKDNAIEFVCWSRTYEDSIKLATDFEQILSKYTWLYQSLGAKSIRYLGWGKTQYRQGNNAILVVGIPIQIYFRSHDVNRLSQKTLETIFVKLTSS